MGLEKERRMSIIQLMKNRYNLISWILVLLLSPSNAEEEKLKSFRIIDEAPADFFESSSDFYSKLRSSAPEHIGYVSKTVVGVPKGKYHIPGIVKYDIGGKPTILLLKAVEGSQGNKKGYLVCTVAPYSEREQFETIETEEKGWLQGTRRFDVWHYDGESWKVVLGVDPLEDDVDKWFSGNAYILHDDLTTATKFLQKKLALEKESRIKLYKAMFEAINEERNKSTK